MVYLTASAASGPNVFWEVSTVRRMQLRVWETLDQDRILPSGPHRSSKDKQQRVEKVKTSGTEFIAVILECDLRHTPERLLVLKSWDFFKKYIHTCLYICVCVYIYTYIYMHVYVYAHTRVHIYTYMHISVYMYVCVYAYIHTCVWYVYIYAHRHIHMHAYIYIYTYTLTHIYVYIMYMMYMHTPIHTHIS